jgi:hypothetical protein
MIEKPVESLTPRIISADSDNRSRKVYGCDGDEGSHNPGQAAQQAVSLHFESDPRTQLRSQADCKRRNR